MAGLCWGTIRLWWALYTVKKGKRFSRPQPHSVILVTFWDDQHSHWPLPSSVTFNNKKNCIIIIFSCSQAAAWRWQEVFSTISSTCIRYFRKTAELFGFVLHDRLMVYVHLILSGNDVPGRSHSFIPGIRDSMCQSQGQNVSGKLWIYVIILSVQAPRVHNFPHCQWFTLISKIMDIFLKLSTLGEICTKQCFDKKLNLLHFLHPISNWVGYYQWSLIQHLPCVSYKKMWAFKPVLWISDILVRIRGSVPLTDGSGSCFFRHRLTRCQKTLSFFQSFWLITFWRYIYISFNKKLSKEVEIKVFLTFLLVDERIRMAQKHMDPTDPDPDPQHWFKLFSYHNMY